MKVIFGMVIIACCFICVVKASKQCLREDMHFKRSNDKRLIVAKEYQTIIDVKQVEQCLGACRMDEKCKSFNGIQLQNNAQCQLLSLDKYDLLSNLTENSTSSYFEQITCTIQKTSTIQTFLDANDCLDVYNKGFKEDGLYKITINGKEILTYCEMNVNGGSGGWTVINRRVDGSVSFRRKWHAYSVGFGNPSGNFWFGNRNIHWLTAKHGNQVLFVMKTFNVDSPMYMALYNQFNVANEISKFKLSIGEYQKISYPHVASNQMMRHNGMKFSTFYQDNDIFEFNCAENYGAGWHEKCQNVQFLGKYSPVQKCVDIGTCIHWRILSGYDLSISLKYAKILIHRKEETYL